MSLSEQLFWWCIVILGIGGSAICSGLEVGLYSINRALVRVHAAGGERRKRAQLLESQIEHPAPLLTSLLVWNNIFNYGGTLAITTLLATQGLSDGLMILIQVVVLTPVLLIFAESTPKEVFRSNANTLMERYARLLWFLRLSLTWIPIVPATLLLANGVAKLVGVDSFGSLTSARSRMAELIKFGAGEMSETQVSLIDRALELEHAIVRSEMIPMKNAAVIRSNWSLEKTKGYVKAHSFTRFPVISPKGQVLGVLDGIDLYIAEDLESKKSVEDFLHETVRVDARLSVSQALGELSRAGAHLGIVTLKSRDIGMVTRKDLVEPLVGELEDW